MRLDMLLNSPFYFFSQSSLQDFALLVSLNGPEKSYLFPDQSEVI